MNERFETLFFNNNKLILTEAQLIRYWSKISVKNKDECWLWTGSIWGHLERKVDSQYGAMNINGKRYFIHRISYFLYYGYTELDILHTCDFGLCQNPEHLYAGTHQNNMDDMIKRKRCPVVWRHFNDIEARVIYKLRHYMTTRDVAKLFNSNNSNIVSIQKGKSYKHIHVNKENLNILSEKIIKEKKMYESQKY